MPVRTSLLALLAAAAMPAMEDIDLGPEARISSDDKGRFLIVNDPRTRREYLINKSRIVVVRSSRTQDQDSVTEIHVSAADSERVFVLRIQERNISYQAIRLELLK